MGRQPVESTLALLSSANRTGRWRAKDVTQATALLGSCTLDLRYAEIEGNRLVVRAPGGTAGTRSVNVCCGQFTARQRSRR